MDQNFKILPIYEESFRRKVIEEYLASGCTKKGLLAKYQIGGKGAIQRWMRLYGYADIHMHQKKKVKFKLSFSKSSFMPKDSSNNSNLQKKILELERQLADEKLRSEAYLRIIEHAEKELKIQIKKKPSTK